MKDLEIRGAGNLLGGEQSGHIAGVGFDLYVRMVGEAVADFRGRRRRRELARGQGRAAGRRAPPARLRARASGCGWRRTASSPPSATTTELDGGRAPSSSTATASCPSRSRTCCRWRGSGCCARQRRARRRRRCRATTSASRPVELRECQELRLQRLYPGSLVKAGGPYDPGAEADDRPGRRPAAARRRAAALVPRRRRGRAARRRAGGARRQRRRHDGTGPRSSARAARAARAARLVALRSRCSPPRHWPAARRPARRARRSSTATASAPTTLQSSTAQPTSTIVPERRPAQVQQRILERIILSRGHREGGARATTSMSARATVATQRDQLFEQRGPPTARQRARASSSSRSVVAARRHRPVGDGPAARSARSPTKLAAGADPTSDRRRQQAPAAERTGRDGQDA